MAFKIDPDPGQQIVALFKLTDWTEPWLVALISFHLLLMALNLKFRNCGSFQLFLFIALCEYNDVEVLSVYFSESINQLAAENWRAFARKQYFDSSGLFISVVFSTPSLFNCMIIVGNWLYQSSLLMIQVKQAQLLQLEEESFRKEAEREEKPVVVKPRRSVRVVKRASVGH
ncbi:unnamed protein product [Notodromas monacha]|uniref:Transmembrane protein 18 n=1 Tax=Notodromas monacha TaxID=399045 RepID=A0A7R9BL70_9CRUS|nr:unnamed protein product [Notodromas monacha]CAG0916435.1 unnamed protein product [Notodromas monacha]